jgi:hypothetical protein
MAITTCISVNRIEYNKYDSQNDRMTKVCFNLGHLVSMQRKTSPAEYIAPITICIPPERLLAN